MITISSTALNQFCLNFYGLNFLQELILGRPNCLHGMTKSAQTFIEPILRTVSSTCGLQLLCDNFRIDELIKKVAISSDQSVVRKLMRWVFNGSVYRPTKRVRKFIPTSCVASHRQACIGTESLPQGNSGTCNYSVRGVKGGLIGTQILKSLLFDREQSVSLLKIYGAIELPSTKQNRHDREKSLGDRCANSPPILVAPVFAITQCGLQLDAYIRHVERRAKIHRDASLSCNGQMVGDDMFWRKVAS